MRPPEVRLFEDEIVVDSFAGGGGTSVGIEQALGRSPDIAINHDPEAIAMHAVNHPDTKHFCESIWKVDPKKAVGGKRVGLAWFSPDCKHFSKAKGGKPVEKKIRGLAWVVISWAQKVRPRVIVLENVEEFQDWGPLLADGRPDKARKGKTFKAWVAKLRNLGYAVEWRQLRACDFGAPTTRKRFFLIARCDGQPIAWPMPSHGPGLAKPHRAAAECITWENPVWSIFGRKKPLAEKTQARIARGIRKYVIEDADPFIVPLTHHGERRVHPIGEPFPTITGAHRGELAIAAAHLVQRSWGERDGQAPRCLDIKAPLGTIVGGGIKHALVNAFLAKHNGGHEATASRLADPAPTITSKDQKALVAAFAVKFYGTSTGGPLDQPMATITAGGWKIGEVRAFLAKYFGKGEMARSPRLPFDTLTSRARYGIVLVAGEEYLIYDIGMRMLEPRELFRAQGFPESYKIDVRSPAQRKGRLSKTAQIRMVGNSVCPPLAAAILRANFVEQVATDAGVA